MNNLNNISEKNDITTKDEVYTVEEMIIKCGDLITEAVNSNNIDQLKGILQVCTIDSGISEKELDELVKLTVNGKNKSLSDEEIESINGGIENLGKPFFSLHGAGPVVGAIAAVIGVGCLGFTGYKIIKNKNKNK